MNQVQIDRIQKFKGDFIEEYWKPGPLRTTKSYVDLYYFWIFRDKSKCCDFNHLRPNNTNTISIKLIKKYERLQSYYYTAYCRTAYLHQCINDFEQFAIQRGPLYHFNFLNTFESFYLFLGSALDNIGAVGNIVLGNPKKEDSFSNFLKFIKNQCYSTQYPDIVKTLVEINDIKDNYRTQIAHRGRIGTHWKGYLNIPIPYVQSGLKGKISPEHTMSWREEFRDVEKGRIPTIPIPQLCYEHLLILEKAVNSVFSLCAANLKSFYDYNNVKLIKDPSKRLTKLKPAPADAEWILFRCRESHQPYLKTWIHDLTDPLPEVCIGETCNSPAIDAL